MVVCWSDGHNPDFVALTHALDAYFRSILGNRQAAFDPHNRSADLQDVAIGYIGGQAVACAALKRHPDGVAEVKRVYVSPKYRGAGIAAQLLEALVARALAAGYDRLLVETNPLFTDAVRLYTRHGFTPIAPFGPYQGMETLCLVKTITGCHAGS